MSRNYTRHCQPTLPVLLLLHYQHFERHGREAKTVHLNIAIYSFLVLVLLFVPFKLLHLHGTGRTACMTSLLRRAALSTYLRTFPLPLLPPRAPRPRSRSRSLNKHRGRAGRSTSGRQLTELVVVEPEASSPPRSLFFGGSTLQGLARGRVCAAIRFVI